MHLQVVSKIYGEFFWVLVLVAADVAPCAGKHSGVVLCELHSPMYSLDAGLLLSHCCVCFHWGHVAFFCRVDVEASFIVSCVLWSGAKFKLRSIQFSAFLLLCGFVLSLLLLPFNKLCRFGHSAFPTVTM